MSLFGLRALRISPNIIDEKIAAVVRSLKTVEFLKGTQFEARAVAMGVDPYSVLLGFLVGVAATLVLGALTLEILVTPDNSKGNRQDHSRGHEGRNSRPGRCLS